MTDFRQSFDARDWAKAFVEQARKTPGLERDEGTMVAWFANALMRGFDEHARQVGVSAEETKPCPKCGGGARSSTHPCACAVGARPEDPNQCDYRNGLGQCVLPRGHGLGHMGAEDFKPRCTACACERCAGANSPLPLTSAERAFLRALAKDYAGHPHAPSWGPTQDAARKVVG